MAGLGWKRDRVGEVVRRQEHLEGAFQKAVGRLGSSHLEGFVRSLVGQWHRDLLRVRSSIRALARERETQGLVTRDASYELRDSFAAASRSAREFDKLVAIRGGRPSQFPPFQNVYRRQVKLGEAIRSLLAPPTRRPQRMDPDKDPEYEQPRKLRNAIRALDKRAARKLSLEDLARWCGRIPVFDWDDPRLLCRLAKFYLASLETFQVWEIRYRSRAPGRPLNLLTITSELPDPEFLQACNEMYGPHDVYYIAATVPRWRVVWLSSWNNL